MIEYVKVTNSYGDSVKIVLANEEPKHGLLIKSISGLGPAKANINTGKFATADGSFYNSARLDPRNIVMNLVFNWADTIEETRLATYKYFPIKRYVDLLFKTDTRLAKTRGYVETNEPNIFSNGEETSISIVCPDPFFYANKDTTIDFSNVLNLLEFPVENNSLSSNLIEVSSNNVAQQLSINYEGDVSTGINVTASILAPTGDFTLANLSTGEEMTVYDDRIAAFTGSTLKAGDTIKISTERGSKKVTLNRNNKNINILNCLGPDVDWLRLDRGTNDIYVNAANGNTNIDVKFNFKTVYEGV